MTACPFLHNKHHVIRHFLTIGFGNEKVTYVFFGAFPFFFFSYQCRSAVINLLLDLFPVQRILRKHHRDGQIYHGVATCSCRQFCSEFSLKFLSIFVLISDSTEPIILFWVSLVRSFPPAELEYR